MKNFKSLSRLKKKPKVAILALDPENFGGVLSSLKLCYKILEKEFEPTAFFLDFSKELSKSFKNLNPKKRVEHSKIFSMNCVKIGASWPFYEPGHYSFSLDIWKKELEEFEYFFVTSGTAIAAHPLVLLNKKFVLWAATPFLADREDRVRELSFFRKALNFFTEKRMLNIEKSVLSKTFKILPMSFYAKREFEKILGPLKNTKEIKVCGFGLKIEENNSEEKDFSKKIIISVARFTDPRKNIDMLLKAFFEIEKEHPDSKLILIGNVSRKEKEIIQKSKNIFNSSGITNEQKNFFYKQASLMLITSNQEGLGISGLEAMSHSIPVISTDCGGVLDFVKNGKTGFIVKKNDHFEMARIAKELLKNPEEIKKLGRKAREFVCKNFSYKKISEEIISAVKSLQK